MTAASLVTFATRLLLVALFLPFSALDKTLNFRGAVAQAREIAPSESLARLLILTGLAVEILMPLAILSGVADRAAGLIMAGYCGVTALLFKRFWRHGDFWVNGESQARTIFWDFCKNFALAGGFLLLTFGLTEQSVRVFINHPVSSTHPYSSGPDDPP